MQAPHRVVYVVSCFSLQGCLSLPGFCRLCRMKLLYRSCYDLNKAGRFLSGTSHGMGCDTRQLAFFKVICWNRLGVIDEAYERLSVLSQPCKRSLIFFVDKNHSAVRAEESRVGKG